MLYGQFKEETPTATAAMHPFHRPYGEIISETCQEWLKWQTLHAQKHKILEIN